MQAPIGTKSFYRYVICSEISATLTALNAISEANGFPSITSCKNDLRTARGQIAGNQPDLCRISLKSAISKWAAFTDFKAPDQYIPALLKNHLTILRATAANGIDNYIKATDACSQQHRAASTSTAPQRRRYKKNLQRDLHASSPSLSTRPSRFWNTDDTPDFQSSRYRKQTTYAPKDRQPTSLVDQRKPRRLFEFTTVRCTPNTESEPSDNDFYSDEYTAEDEARLDSFYFHPSGET